MRPPVFIPRPETEMLVDLVLKEVDEKNLNHVVELCCGSGAIALSLLYERPEVNSINLFRTAFNYDWFDLNYNLRTSDRKL